LEGQKSERELDNPILYLFGGGNFHTSPCLMLLTLQFQLVDFIKDVQHGREAHTPGKNDNFVAISRKNYVVNIHEIQAWQWHFLKSLQSTKDYNTSTANTAATCGISKENLMADLMLWLPVATSFGFIYTAE
jgi:hypothetical protein